MNLRGICRTAVVLMICLGAAGPLWAQTGRVYSLTDLYRIALSRSEAIGIAEYDAAIAERGRDKARAALRPGVTAFGSHTRYSEDKTAGGMSVQPSWTAQWGVQLSQSVTLNGREWKSLRAAERDIDRAGYDLDTVRANQLFDVATAYYDVLKAIKAVEITGANVRRLITHLDAVKARLELEDVAKTALYRAEAELSQAQADRISAENGLKLAQAVLARVTGLPRIDRIEDPGLRESLTFSARLASLKRTALANRPELKSREVQAEMAETGIEIAKSAYWPVVTAEGTYLDTAQDPESDFTADDSLSVGVTVSMPLYDGGTRRADVAEARARRRQSRLGIAATAKSIAVEVERVFLELKTHAGVLTSLKDQLRSSQENFRAVSRQFEYGLATSVDVMDANTVLVTSEKRLIESRYDFQLGLLKLKRATGTFLSGVEATLNGGGDGAR
jgi:outer membrane protein